MPGGGNAVGGGVQETYDGSGAFLLGEVVVLGKVHGVWGGYGARVSGGPYSDAAWECSGWETALGKHSPWWGSTYLQDEFSNRWGTAELPRRGVSGTGGDGDDDVGSFLSPSCLRYHHHIGGGKPLLTTVPLMRHVVALACTEQEAPCH